MVPDVVAKLGERERMIAEASIKMPVKQYPDAKLVEKWKILMLGIARDVGISYWNNPDAMRYPLTRTMDIVKRFYKNLTISDVKMAFELLLIGELDDFLPKGRDNQPDRNHYQELSLEYMTKVLNAYNKKLAEVWHKALKSIPKIEATISQAQQIENYNHIVDEIYDAFDKFKASKTKPEFVLQVQISKLADKGLLEIVPADKTTTATAYNKLLISGEIGKLERSKMIDEYERNKVTHPLKCEAQRIQNNKTIAAYFQKLIKAKKEIRDVLEKM